MGTLSRRIDDAVVLGRARDSRCELLVAHVLHCARCGRLALHLISLRRLSFVSLVFLPLATCLEPTEVRVTIYSNICETLDVAISVNDNAPSARKTFRAQACGAQSGRLGDIVFVPTAGQGRFTFHVNAAAPGGDCATNTRCVSASRNVAYLSHTSIDLAVELTSDCIGVPCPDGQTCTHGVCVDNVVDCKNNKCDDAGPPDVVVEDVIALEGVVPVCMPPKRLLFAQLTPAFRWSFNTVNNMITELMTMKQVALVNGNTTSAANMAFGCGEALTIFGSQPLGVTSASKGLGMSAYVYVPSSSTTTILLKKRGTGLQGVTVFVDFNHVLQVQTCDTQACSYAEFPALPTDKWTSVEVKAPSSGTIEVTYDGAMRIATTGFINLAAFIAGTLELGVGDKGILDELRVYDVN